MVTVLWFIHQNAAAASAPAQHHLGRQTQKLRPRDGQSGSSDQTGSRNLGSASPRLLHRQKRCDGGPACVESKDVAGELAWKHHAAFRWLALLGWRWRSVSHSQRERASRGMDFSGSGCQPPQRHWRPPLCSLPPRCPARKTRESVAPAARWEAGFHIQASKQGPSKQVLMSAPRGMRNFPDQGWNPCLHPAPRRGRAES